MKKICSALSFLLMMVVQQVGAVDEQPPSKSDCEQLLEICSPASKNLVATDLKSCGNCKDMCGKAKEACARETKDLNISEKLSQANENLSRANAFHLWCKNECRKTFSENE